MLSSVRLRVFGFFSFSPRFSRVFCYEEDNGRRDYTHGSKYESEGWVGVPDEQRSSNGWRDSVSYVGKRVPERNHRAARTWNLVKRQTSQRGYSHGGEPHVQEIES